MATASSASVVLVRNRELNHAYAFGITQRRDLPEYSSPPEPPRYFMSYTQLNSITEAARTGHDYRRSYPGCVFGIRPNISPSRLGPNSRIAVLAQWAVSAHPRSTQVVVQCEVTQFMHQIHPCLAAYRPFPLVRHVIDLAVNRSCHSRYPRFRRPDRAEASLTDIDRCSNIPLW